MISDEKTVQFFEHLLINVLEQVFREIHKTENSKIKTGFILHSIKIFHTSHLDAECMFGWPVSYTHLTLPTNREV